MTEMEKALTADGEKLRALTGQDHGPFLVCKFCDGTGTVLDDECPICCGTGNIELLPTKK